MFRNFLVCFALFVPLSASAGLVTTTYEITIDSIGSGGDPGYLGHVFSVAITYDDAGTAMHRYDNGENDIQEAGGGDDTVSATWLVVNFPEFAFFSDATMVFKNEPAAIGNPKDFFSSNWQRAQGGNLGYRDFDMNYRSIFFSLYDPWTRPSISVDFNRYTDDGFERYRSRSVTRVSTVEAVPLPATLWLFLPTLLALGFIRRRSAT